jgi:hypothetical protein
MTTFDTLFLIRGPLFEPEPALLDHRRQTALGETLRRGTRSASTLILLDKKLSILETGLNVLPSQARVVSKQFIEIWILGKLGKDQVDWNASAFNHRLTDEDLRISHDSILVKLVSR